MRKVTLEQKKKAVEIALAGGDCLGYLKSIGSKQPAALWYKIRQDLKEAEPETYEKLPERIGAKPKEPKTVNADEYGNVVFDDKGIFPLQQDEEITDDEPSHFLAEDVLQETEEDDLEITAIRNKLLGRFQFDENYDVMVWNSPYGDEVVMDAEHWWKMADLLPRVLQKLKIDRQEGEI